MTEPKTISELMKLVMEECKKVNINNSIIYLNKAIEIEPNNVFAYRLRGDSKRKLGDYQGAINDYSKAIEIYPNKAYLYNYRASAKRKLGDNEGANEDDRKAEKLKNIF